MRNMVEQTWMPENKRKNAHLRIVSIILAVLLVISVAALAARYIYLGIFASDPTTDTVTGNLIGESLSVQATAALGENEIQAENGYPTASAFALSSRSATAEVKTVGTTSNGQTTSLELYQGVPEVNEKFTAENMLPGDAVKKNFSVKVNHKKEIALYFNTEITQETKNLSDVLQIKVTDLNSGEVLCNGSFAELNEKEFSVLLPQNAQGSTTVNYEIEVSADTSIGNEYQAAALMADFHWFVEDEGSLTPDTDDYLTLGLWLVGFLLCAALLIVVFVMLKRAKGEKKA